MPKSARSHQRYRKSKKGGAATKETPLFGAPCGHSDIFYEIRECIAAFRSERPPTAPRKLRKGHLKVLRERRERYDLERVKRRERLRKRAVRDKAAKVEAKKLAAVGFDGRAPQEDLRPLEQLLRDFREAERLMRRAAACTPSYFAGELSKFESDEVRKELQREFEKMVQQRAFTEWVTLQPNGSISRKGQTLREALPKMFRMVNPMVFGKDAPAPWNRHKCIQGIAFFEGAIDDHVHIAIFSEYQVSPKELEDAFRTVFTKFFKKGTVWVDALDDENRKDIIHYCCKEMWKRGRYDDAEFFGPNWGTDGFDVPFVEEAHLRPRERVWPQRTIRTPDFQKADPAGLKYVLQEAQETGRWFGPDPRYMPYEELEREARAVIVAEGRRAEKLARARAMLGAKRRVRFAKYRLRAGAVHTPHSHRLTPDICGPDLGRLGSLTLQQVQSHSRYRSLARGPPLSQSETPLTTG